jgi:hypothetical protein
MRTSQWLRNRSQGKCLSYKDMEKLTQDQIRALKIVLDFVERWNKQDKERMVAYAQEILGELLTKNEHGK